MNFQAALATLADQVLAILPDADAETIQTLLDDGLPVDQVISTLLDAAEEDRKVGTKA